jgi:SAM-dependent methyltransferase
MNKVRYAFTGYHRPREFAVEEIKKAAQYDHEVVERWEAALKERGFGDSPFLDQRILELGPGADLGVGLLLAAKGAKSYVAFDKNPLADRAPRALHKAIVESIEYPEARKRAADALKAYEAKKPTTVIFKQDSSFSFSWIPDASVDLIVSNAAFEHFDNVPRVLREVARVLAPGGVLCAHVDLQTHTRVLRDRDPLNLYRYPAWVLRLAKFSGIPNRVRPHVYEEVLSKLGFSPVSIIPVTQMKEKRVRRDSKYLHAEFRDDPTLGVLSFIVVAKK